MEQENESSNIAKVPTNERQELFLRKIARDIAPSVGRRPFKREILLLANIHCIPSIIPLFSTLIHQFDVQPGNIFVSPKSYSHMQGVEASLKAFGICFLPSTHPKVGQSYSTFAKSRLDDLCELAWHAAEERRRPIRFVLLDGSGALTAAWYNKFRSPKANTVSIQQTTSGFRKIPLASTIPMINVAQSATKRHIENHVIAKGIFRKITQTLALQEGHHIGIVGLGAIGQALAGLALKNRFRVSFLDPQIENDEAHPPITKAHRQSDLFQHADTILGCTGLDWTELSAFDSIKGQGKTLISCSSEDIEYRNLIRHRLKTSGRRHSPYQTLNVQSHKTGEQHQILNGGFPVNFDRKTEWEGDDEILITRGLILLSIVQAMTIRLENVRRNLIIPEPAFQQRLVTRWIEHCCKALTGSSFLRHDLDSMTWYKTESIGWLHQE